MPLKISYVNIDGCGLKLRWGSKLYAYYYSLQVVWHLTIHLLYDMKQFQMKQ